MSTKTLTHLQRLEAESIHILREVAAEAENPVMLYSVGKDSAVMLHLAKKAFYPAPPPFPAPMTMPGWKASRRHPAAPASPAPPPSPLQQPRGRPAEVGAARPRPPGKRPWARPPRPPPPLRPSRAALRRALAAPPLQGKGCPPLRSGRSSHGFSLFPGASSTEMSR